MDIAASAALHGRVQEVIRAFERDPSSSALDDGTFTSLACDLARYQLRHSEGYARLCKARGIDATALQRVDDIPAVPTEAFRVARVATFDETQTQKTFRTSGTSVGARGVHVVRDVATYDMGAVAFGRRWLMRDAQRSWPVLVLHPSPGEVADSSLAHMCAKFVEAFGEPSTLESTWLIARDVLDLSAFDERVAVALTQDRPVLVLATSFALVHLLDAVGDATFELPRGSRVMQTGGFKGKSREIPAAQLRRELARIFRIDPTAIVAEYGMTELSSQFYEKTLFDEGARHGIYAEPPWARIVPVDPESLAPVPNGEEGLAKIVDLANVDSAVVVLTQDRVRRVEGGIELLGRSAGAPPRGCSIAVDELLGKAK